MHLACASHPSLHTQTLLRRAADNFNVWDWSRDDVLAYLRDDALKPALPVAVLLPLCALTLAALVLW